MNSTILLIRQIIVMFLYMGLGFCLFRTKKLTREGTRDIANLLINLVIPAVMLKSYAIEPTAQRLQEFGISALASLLALVLAMTVARLLLGKNGLEDFAASFSNSGFLGIPLVQAALGEGAVFYVVTFVAFLNIFQWTYGVSRLTEKPLRLSASILCHPLILCAVLAMVLFLTGLGAKMPGILSDTLSGISALNAPLAMMVLGGYLAQAKLPELFKRPGIWKICAVRLALIPVLTLLMLKLLAVPGDMAVAILIVASAPVGANVAVYAQLHNKDYVYGSTLVVVSTLLSIVSMPLIILLAESLLK